MATPYWSGTGVVFAAFKLASELHSQHVGPEHLFAVVLGGAPDSDARDVLLSVGVDVERFDNDLGNASLSFGASSNKKEVLAGPKGNPVFFGALGRAEGFALAKHGGDPSSLDILVSLLWSRPNRHWVTPLSMQGIRREMIVERLIDSGVMTPNQPLPPEELPGN
jgi:ATP-dependent Clp protease ATP-binding subunit ClpA